MKNQKVTSIGELFTRAATELREAEAAIITRTLEEARQWLEANAVVVQVNLAELVKAPEAVKAKAVEGTKPAAQKPKAAGNKSQAGSSAYIRELFAAGLDKATALIKATEKYPIMATGTQFEDRWEAAKNLGAKKAPAVPVPVKAKAKAVAKK